MERVPLESTSIASAGYQAETQTLEIEFRSGQVYRYLEVPEEIYIGLMAAESAGGYFMRRIREHFAFERLPVSS
ncbi:MAG TPA: KTSC domain-containing protein [Candidatus Acidoferrales bacterium]|nr:KTSC domain-containing protein [Candidatus Acidoferrales bacterium]